MESHDATSRLEALRARPSRVFTKRDIVLMSATPILGYAGGLLATLGSVAGPILSAVAALMLVTIYSTRLSRTNEPAIPRYMFHASIAAAVLIFMNTFGLWHNAPYHSALMSFGLPLLNPFFYSVFLALLLRRRHP